MKKPIPFQKKLYLVFLLGYLVIDVALISYSNYLTRHYREGVRQSGNAMLNLYMNELDTLLMTSRKYIQEVGQQNLHVHVLQYETDEVKKYGAAYELMQSLNDQLILKEEIAGFMIRYDDKCYYSFQNSVSFQEKQEIKASVNEAPAAGTVEKRWQVVGEERPFLVLSHAMRHLYLTVIIDLEDVTSHIVDKYELSSAEILFQNKDVFLRQSRGRVPEDLAERIAQKVIAGDVLTVEGKYMIFSGLIGDTDLWMHVILPDESGITKQNSQFYLFAIMILVLVCMILSYSYVWNSFALPLRHMMETMEKIENGQIDEEMEEEADIMEYRRMAVTFNSMMRQLKGLKIKAYEEELREQKTRLQFFQLQIKPHFFLNYLKTLHALLKQGKTKELEDVLMSMSVYFRYVFRDSFTLVTVEEELHFTREYLNIQKNRVGLDLDYEIEAEPRVMTFTVLPLTVQTFVENSIKHASANGRLKIRVVVKLLEGDGEQFLSIVVADNGQGYSLNWLECLNRKDHQAENGEHIGVLNLKKRLALYYGEAAEFAVRNHGGAVSEVIVPADKRGRKTSGEEGRV